MKKWVIIQRGTMEYDNEIFIKAKNVQKLDKWRVLADGIEIEFTDEISDPEILDEK